MQNSEAIYRSVVEGWSPADKAAFPPGLLIHKSHTGSTNDDLSRALKEKRAGHGTLICADQQSAGRGRRGDRWESPAGRNLLFSLALRLPDERRFWSRLPHAVGKWVGSAVEDIVPDGAQLQSKWPNDLLVEGKKLAGILVETVMTSEAYAIVGVGINVNMRADEYPPTLADQVTSIYELVGCESSRWFLLGLILRNIIAEYPEALTEFDDSILSWIRPRDYLKDKHVRMIAGGRGLSGTVRGRGENGELTVETENGETTHLISADMIRVVPPPTIAP